MHLLWSPPLCHWLVLSAGPPVFTSASSPTLLQLYSPVLQQKCQWWTVPLTCLEKSQLHWVFTLIYLCLIISRHHWSSLWSDPPISLQKLFQIPNLHLQGRWKIHPGNGPEELSPLAWWQLMNHNCGTSLKLYHFLLGQSLSVLAD